MRLIRLPEVTTSITTPRATVTPMEASSRHEAPTYQSMATTMAPMIMPVPRSCCSTTNEISSRETGTNGTSRCFGRSSRSCLRARMSAPQTTMASFANSDGWMRKKDVPNCTQLRLPLSSSPHPSGVKVSSWSTSAPTTRAQPRIFNWRGVALVSR